MTRKAIILLLCVSLPALVFGGSTAGSAQTGVLERARPDYDARGMPLGAFRLFPVVTLGVLHDDNIYRDAAGTESDVFFQVAPRLALESQWSQHALNLYGGMEFLKYSEFHSEDQTNWDIGADGRLDIQRGTLLTGNASHRQTHEPRFSPDLPGNVAEPIPYSLSRLGGEFEFKPNRFGIALGATLYGYDYDSSPLVEGGVLNNNDRDRDQHQVYARASYDFSPGYSAFLRATYDSRDFALESDRTGVNRDSNGYRIVGGIDMLVGRLVTGQIFVGYVEQSYKLPLTDVSGLDYGAGLTWYATELMTFHLNAAHLINDTTIGGASASDDQTVSGGVDYEILRNVIAVGSVAYTNSNFRGSTREDGVVSTNLGVRYLINRYMSAEVKHQYSNRNSSVPNQDYGDNLISLALRLHE